MTGLGEYTLIAVDGPRWHGLRQRHQHLLEGLSKHFGRTIYVEPTASYIRSLLFRTYPLSELWEHMRPPKKLGDKLWLVKSPPGLPRSLGYQRVNRINRRKSARRIRQLLSPDEKVVLWIGGPKAAEIMDMLDTELVIYDCYDAFSTFQWEAHHASFVDKMERKLLIESDIILTTSIGLMEKAGNEDPRVHLVRNACNYEHFATRRDPSPDFKPAIDLASMPHPLIGYMGDIAEWFDQDLVAFLAKSRPQWNFVFFGPLQHDLSKLTRFTNLHFPGRVPYADLPLYLHHFDCLLIPFVLSDLTMEVNPVKMYEYLATGKPVVSSAMPEVVRHEDVVGIGRSPEDFLAKMDAAITGDSEEKAEARRAVARANSWTERVERTASIIADALANK